MNLIVAPVEVLVFIGVAYGLYRFFVYLLNSSRLDRNIEKVVHPTVFDDEEVIDSFETALSVAKKRVAATDAELVARKDKNERLRKTVGG